MILYDSTNYSGSFIHQVQIAYKGNSNAPQPGSDKYNQYLAIANRLRNGWMMDADHHWNSLFEARTYGPITEANQSYDLDGDAFFVSDGVSILRTDGNTDWFRLVQPKERNDHALGARRGFSAGDFGLPLCYLTGSASGQGNNLTLVFVDPWVITSGGQSTVSLDVGGTIQLGVYVLLADLVNTSDEVVVDDPYWLVWQTASELARNDPAKQDQVPNLSGMANEAYEKMVTLNDGNSYEQPRGPRYLMPRIGESFNRF